MSLVDTIRAGIAVIDGVFKDVEGDVIHKAWIGQTGAGRHAYAPPVTHKAIIDQRVRKVYSASGELQLIKASLIFLEPIEATTPNPPFTRMNPIDPLDILILPDGTTGPIVLSGGLTDSGTTHPYYNEVALGASATSQS